MTYARPLIALLGALLLSGCLKPRDEPTANPDTNRPAEVLIAEAVLGCLRSQAVVAFEKMVTQSPTGVTDWPQLQKRMTRLTLRVAPDIQIAEMRGAPPGQSSDTRIVALGDTSGGSVTVARIVREEGQPRLEDILQMTREEFDPLPSLWKPAD